MLKARFTDKPLQIEWYQVKDLEMAPWNPNTMTPDQYSALLSDMKTAGPLGVDPLVGASKRTVYGDEKLEEKVVVLDGNHRLKAARELGWDQVRVIVDTSVNSEQLARVVSYTRNNERGTLDPFKAAENFRFFADRGMTQDEIAKEFHIDRTTVSKRLSLLNVTSEVKEKALKETSRGLTASHLEAIAPLAPELQKKAFKEIEDSTRYDKDRAVTVRYVEEVARDIKEEDKLDKEFAEAVAKAKFPKCPKCGQPPKRSYRRLPETECSSGNWQHAWSINTGKTQAQVMAEHRVVTKKKKEPPKPPTTFKVPYTVNELEAAALNHLKEVVPKLTKAEFNPNYGDGIGGLVGDRTKFAMYFGQSSYGGGDFQFRYETGSGKEKEELDFEVGPIKNRTKADNEAKLLNTVDVDGMGVRSEKHLVELQGIFEKWFAKYKEKRKGK